MKTSEIYLGLMKDRKRSLKLPRLEISALKENI